MPLTKEEIPDVPFSTVAANVSPFWITATLVGTAASAIAGFVYAPPLPRRYGAWLVGFTGFVGLSANAMLESWVRTTGLKDSSSSTILLGRARSIFNSQPQLQQQQQVQQQQQQQHGGSSSSSSSS
ncbi:hypothetical protein QOT17_009018 [Balamuthia mandrillaris]